MIRHEAKIKAICWVKNRKVKYDIWQGKDIDDKDCVNITEALIYTSNIQGHNLDYKENLIKKIMEIDSKNKGLTHLEVWEKGQMIDIFRITNFPSKGEFKNWNEVADFIRKR